MAAIPKGVLESALNLEDRAHDDALAQDITGQTARLQQQQALQPPTPQWSLPSLDALLGGGTTQPQAAQTPQQQAVPTQPVQQEQRTQGWQLPSLDVLLGRDPNARPEPAQMAQQQAPLAASGASAAMPTTGGAISQEPGDLRAWARQEAVRLGIDPDIAERVAMSEGGFDDPVRQSDVVYQGQREQSYGPYQLNVNGGLGNEALAQGIDPRNPAHARAAVTFALEHAARNGWGNFHGAARVGVGERDGIGQAPAQRPGMTTPPQAEQTPAAQAQAFAAGSWTPNQIEAATAEGLDYETALAVCGPAAAIAFARKNGRNPTMQEALALAREVGWTAAAGMAGPASQQRLLERMGVASRLVDGAPDWRAVAADVQRGNPVTISTPGHYFVAERYDPESGAFDFGQSAKVLKASGGRTWFRPEELVNLGMGDARATLFIDNPESPTPSIAAGDMPRLSLNAAQPPAPGGSAAPPAPAGVSSAPAGAPPAPWEQPGANDGGQAFMKAGADDEYDPRLYDEGPREVAPPPVNDAMLPGDGGVAPTPEYDPRTADEGPRESRPQPIPPTDPTVSDPAYTQNPAAAPMVDPLDPSTITPAALPPLPNGPRMMQPAPQYRDPREGQGIVARGIDAIGQLLPSAPIVDTKPGDAGAFMGGMPNTPGKLWEWRGRVAEGAADALARGTGMDPDALVLNVEVGGVPLKMTVSELLENVTDPLLAAGWGVGDMVLDAAGKAVLRVVAPYARGAARETIGRLINSEPVQRGVEAVREGAEAVGRGLGEAAQGAGTFVRDIAEEAAYQATFGPRSMARNVVPPGVARQIPMETRLPDSSLLREAIENTPGVSLTDDGLEMNVQRFQRPKDAGNEPSSGGVFYGPDNGPGRSPYNAKEDPEYPPMYGGPQEIRGTTLVRRPFIETGGNERVTLERLAVEAGRSPDEASEMVFDFMTLGRNGFSEDAYNALARRWGVPEMLPGRGAPDLRVYEGLRAALARQAGYDSIVRVNQQRLWRPEGDVIGPPKISEIHDLREATYPTPDGGFTLRPEFQPRAPDTTPQARPAPSQRLAQATEQRVAAAEAESAALRALESAQTYGTPQEIGAARRAYATARQAASAAVDAENAAREAAQRFDTGLEAAGMGRRVDAGDTEDAVLASQREGTRPPGYRSGEIPTTRDDTPRSPGLNAAPPYAERGAGLGTRIAADAGASLQGGVVGAAAGYGLPADSEEERRRNALYGAGAGMVGMPIAGRAVGRGMRGAGAGTRAGIVPPHVADRMPTPVRVPEDPEIVRAIENAGGSVDRNRGITIPLVRAQEKEAAGRTAFRAVVYYEPAGGGRTRSSYWGEMGSGGNDFGGDQTVGPGPTRLRNPLITTHGDDPHSDLARQIGIDLDAVYKELQGSVNERDATHLLEDIDRLGGDSRVFMQALDRYAGNANMLLQAATENVIWTRARAAGHDSLMIFQPRLDKSGRFDLTEIGDFREVINPTTARRGGYAIRDEYALARRIPNLPADPVRAPALPPPPDAMPSDVAARIDAVWRERNEFGMPTGDLNWAMQSWNRHLDDDPLRSKAIAVLERATGISDPSEAAALVRTRIAERDRANQWAGVPFDPSSAAMGGYAGALSEGEDGEQGDPLRTLAGAAFAGVAGRMGRGRGVRQTVREATELAEQARRARINPGGVQASMEGFGPPSDILKMFGERYADQRKAERAALEYQRMLEDGASEEQLANFLRSAQDGRLLDRFNTVRYASMLSDPKTHGQNSIGSLVMGALDMANTPFAVLADVVRSRMTGAPRETFMSEIPARLAGWGASAGQGLRDAAFIMRNGLRPQDVTKLDQPNRGFATNIPGLAPAGSRAADTVDAAMELPMRALAAADAFWRGTFTGGHLAAEAIARATRNNAGKPPSAEQIAKAMLDPEVIARADAMAARSVLQESRHAAEGLNKYIQGLPDGVQAVVSTVMPYIRTPFNIVAQGVGMTPLGLISLAQDIRAGKPTREINQRVGRLALGTMAMGWAGWQNMQGNLTGPYPENEAERSTLPPGWRPWSYKVTVPGVGTQYVPIGVLGPVAVPMVASILMTEGAKRGQPFDLDRAAKVAQGIGQFAEDQTFLRSLADLSEALEKGGNTMMNYVERLSTQASPHIVGGGGVGRRIQEILGMPQRDPEGVIEALMATHPALAGLVPPKRDVLGRQQQSGPSGALAVQPFVRSSQERDAPVLRAYRQAKVSLPRGAPKDYDPGDGSGRRPLSRRQREAWKVAFGQALQSEWSNAGSPSDPAELRRVTETARERALSTATGR